MPANSIHPSALNLVAGYQEGCRLLSQAQDIMARRERLSSRCARPVYSVDLKRTMAEYERDTWRRIMVAMFRRGQVNPRRFRDLQARIEAGRVPELSVENLQRVVLESPVRSAR